MDMIKGFRDFIMRGNVVELAVAVVIGAAFNSVVAQFTNSFLHPLIKLISGGKEVSGAFHIHGVKFDWGAFVNTLIGFLLAAATVYFLVVLPMNKLHERIIRGREPKSATPTEEVQLLREIRDALVADRRTVRGQAPGPVAGPTQDGTLR